MALAPGRRGGLWRQAGEAAFGARPERLFWPQDRDGRSARPSPRCHGRAPSVVCGRGFARRGDRSRRPVPSSCSPSPTPRPCSSWRAPSPCSSLLVRRPRWSSADDAEAVPAVVGAEAALAVADAAAELAVHGVEAVSSSTPRARPAVEMSTAPLLGRCFYFEGAMVEARPDSRPGCPDFGHGWRRPGPSCHGCHSADGPLS